MGLEPIRWHSVALFVAVHRIHQHMQRGREGEREGGRERESERGREGFVAGHDMYIYKMKERDTSPRFFCAEIVCQ